MEKVLYKYTENDNNTILIAVQIDEGKTWADTPATYHRVPGPNAALYAYFLANALNKVIRMTFPQSMYVDVTRYSGAYIYPGNNQMIIAEIPPVKTEVLVELSGGYVEHACKTGPDIDLYVIDWDLANNPTRDEDKVPTLWHPMTMNAEQFKTYRTNILNKQR